MAYCDVCAEHRDVESLVLCSWCRNVVHRKCYGGMLLGKSSWLEWLCDQCLLCGLAEVSAGVIPCVVCGMKPGLLKWVRQFGWVHPGCVLYSGSLNFATEEHDCLLYLSKPHSRELCFYCSHPSPWTVKCSFKGCSLFFHTRCAQIQGIRPLRQGESFLRLCREHREEVAGVDAERRAVRRQFRFCRKVGDSLGDTKSEKPAKPQTAKMHKQPLKRTRTLPPPSYFPAIPQKREEKRCLSSQLSSVTGIVQPGTAKELEAQLKAFFRLHKQREDYNFYDVSHMPELVKVLGGGKVEHRLVSSLVLQHSVVLSQ